MTRRRTSALLAVSAAVLATGCGEEERASTQAKQATEPAASTTATRPLDENKSPYQIPCQDMADPLAAAKLTRRATFALADRAKVKGLTRLQASQSIYFAMTELCKTNDPAYRPARDAVKAVKAGRYRANVGTP